jgi:hypothetical protein
MVQGKFKIKKVAAIPFIFFPLRYVVELTLKNLPLGN